MPAHRPAALEVFLDALSACLRVASAGEVADAAFVERLFVGLEAPARIGTSSPGREPEALDQLEPALAALQDADPALRHLGQAFAQVEPLVRWTRRSSSGPEATRFAAGHANAMIVGPGGIEARNDLMVGVSLLAPTIRYPDHTHPPDELYLVLSEGEWRQGKGAWFAPGIGGTVRNPPGIVHAMRAGQKPLFAAWALIA